MEVLESGNKEYCGTIPYGKVSQYGIFKGKLFVDMIIAEESQVIENKKKKHLIMRKYRMNNLNKQHEL